MPDYHGDRQLEDFLHSMAQQNRVYVDKKGTLWAYTYEVPHGRKKKERDRRQGDKDRDRHHSNGRTFPGAIPVKGAIPFRGMWPNFYPILFGEDTKYGWVVYLCGDPPTADEQGEPVKPRRLSYYNPSLAANLGPDCVFVGGLPYDFTESEIRKLLESVGPLPSVHLVKDRETRNSKGSAFCVFEDSFHADLASLSLHGYEMGDTMLTVRRANQDPSQRQRKQESVQKPVLQPTAMPTKVLCVTEVVAPDELEDDQEFEDIMEDTRAECGKFGNLVNVVIPRPDPSGEHGPGVGKVFLEYADVEGSYPEEVIHVCGALTRILYADENICTCRFSWSMLMWRDPIPRK